MARTSPTDANHFDFAFKALGAQLALLPINQRFYGKMSRVFVDRRVFAETRLARLYRGRDNFDAGAAQIFYFSGFQ